MLIRHKRRSDVASHEITPARVYLNRRTFLQASGLFAGSLMFAGRGAAAAVMPAPGAKFADLMPGYSKLGEADAPTPLDAITTYNNFLEFGTGKGDASKHAGAFKPLPWTIKVDGMCAKPGDIGLEDLLKPHALEERIYRMRCVEAWSMVIPWVGIPLGEVIKRFEPLGSAKYIRLETVVRPTEMRAQRRNTKDFPYVEGLRLDEAMHPLTLLAVGIYGQPLLGQNGAPIRLVVPWKYGFKGVKSIARISFTDTEPKNTWQVMNPREFGFYANVNPEVDHPRWTQANERRIDGAQGGGLKAMFAPRRPTLMFNGYAEEVAQMYAGMDLRTSF
jgi:sulfoxide reductase catalytic subunit YedY